MPVAIKGSGGGSVTLDAGAAAADTTLTIPNVTGTVLQSGTAVTVAQGGTGAATLTANAVLIGNGTSAVTAVAPSTAGNVLTSNGTAWASTAPATGSLTLLATLTTTSGTTQSATGLATTYTNLLFVCEAVTSASGVLFLALSSNNGSSYGTATNIGVSTAVNAALYVYRANASAINKVLGGPIGSGSIPTTSAAPVNAIQFSWSGGTTFTAGAIYIYGWN